MYSLCCISNELKENGYSFKTMTWKRFCQLKEQNQFDALKELGDRWLNNVIVTQKCIEHCAQNGWGYRISSNIFPILTHPEFDYNLYSVPQYQNIMMVFEQIKEFNLDTSTFLNKVRLSCHPDQFNVLASNDENAIKRTIIELNYHGWLMDMLGCSRSYLNPINIHVNCSKGDIEEIVMRFMTTYDNLHESVSSRLVVENEDKGIWSVENLYRYFYSFYNIPITFDNLHHKCNPGNINEQKAIELCASTWGKYRSLFHYSESDPSNKNKRAHADFPTDIPPSDEYDWEIELKEKDKAIRYLYLIDLQREAERKGEYITKE